MTPVIEELIDIESASELREEWNDLYRLSGTNNLFLTYAWMQSWMAAFSDNQHVVLLNRTNSHLSSLGVFRREKGCYSFISTEHSAWPGILRPARAGPAPEARPRAARARAALALRRRRQAAAG